MTCAASGGDRIRTEVHTTYEPGEHLKRLRRTEGRVRCLDTAADHPVTVEVTGTGVLLGFDATERHTYEGLAVLRPTGEAPRAGSRGMGHLDSPAGER